VAVKTNAARVLDGLGIVYRIVEYEVDLDDLSAPAVAAKVGFPLEAVWKTLLVQGAGRGELGFAVIAGGAELDLKAVARARGWKSAELAPLKDVTSLTGYVRGGVTVLAAKKAYPAVVDEWIEALDEVCVSAGMRGAQLVLKPADYLRATRAKVAPIARG
jgi:Cys-tRNA(Pro)/Cys-tRNA(Cys) deacylase